MNIDDLELAIHSDITKRFEEYRAANERPDGDGTTVPAGGDLQAALDIGGLITLAPGATYTGPFTVRQSGTTLKGEGAMLASTGKTALTIPPGVNDVSVFDVFAGTEKYSSVVCVGDNALTDIAQVPHHVQLVNVQVPTHRGKRAFELHGADITLMDCVARDIWDPSLSDSQGVWINNGPGPYTISGGLFEAGSENIMVGGSATGIPGLIPADIVIEDCELSKPDSWHTDGVKRAVKTILELKTGQRVTVRRVKLAGVWVDAQTAYAITFTPRNAGAVTDVLVEDCSVQRAGSAFNITGHDEHSKPATPYRTTNITVRNSTFQVDCAQFGGHGVLAQLLHGMGSITFDNVVFVGDGTKFIMVGDAEAVDAITMTASYSVVKKYGLFIATNGSVGTVTFTGNTFTEEPSAFRTAYPENTYVDRATFDALVEPMLPDAA